MSFFESIFYMLWRGLAIGVIISAPMGPVGILCIQRTLDKGRKAGFYTGVGAALSDLFYSLLTGFGLSFIEEFLERNSSIIQLAGSAVLIAFGIFLFRKNPTRQLKRPMSQYVSAKKSILAGFLFTFSNPLILFLIIGLFARFNFLMPCFTVFHYLVGYISLLAGALGWWWLVTYSVDKVRAHFNVRSMWLINRIIGVVILLFAVVGIITSVIDLSSGKANAKEIHLNPKRGFEPLTSDYDHSENSLLLKSSDNLHSVRYDLPFESRTASFDLAMKVESIKKSCWRIEFSDTTRKSSMFLNFAYMEKDDGISSFPALEATAVTSAGSTVKGYAPVCRKMSSTLNCFRIIRDNDPKTGSDILSVYAGISADNLIIEFPLQKDFDITMLGITPESHGIRLHSLFAAIDDAGLLKYKQTPWTDPLLLETYLQESLDPMEGYWQILDRSFDETLLRPGGDYLFAMVKKHDGYDLLYLSGATVNPQLWQPGMTKATLHPCGITGVWDISWTDSNGHSIRQNIKAQKDAAGVLNVNFPYYNSTMRLIKTAAH